MQSFYIEILKLNLLLLCFYKQNIKLDSKLLSYAVLKTIEYSISAYHNRRVTSGSQGSAREGVKRRAGIELLWTEVIRAITVTVAEPAADGAALIPTETIHGWQVSKNMLLSNKQHPYERTVGRVAETSEGGKKAGWSSDIFICLR